MPTDTDDAIALLEGRGYKVERPLGLSRLSDWTDRTDGEGGRQDWRLEWTQGPHGYGARVTEAYQCCCGSCWAWETQDPDGGLICTGLQKSRDDAKYAAGNSIGVYIAKRARK